MRYTLALLLLAVLLFFGMLLMLEVGRRLRLRGRAEDADGSSDGSAALGGSVYALLGLLLAFTFSGAATRFDVRRELIVEETNAIGTAYLRLDLLPPEARAPLKARFREYVGARVEAYRKLPDLTAAKGELARATKLQTQIWEEAVAACRKANHPPATMLLLPAINAMIDITTTRTLAAQTHPPMIIFILLCAMALAASLVAGHGISSTKSRSRVNELMFAATIAVSVYVIIDLEYPRGGLIRVETFDQALVELLQGMK
jgi:hypothetical protein